MIKRSIMQRTIVWFIFLITIGNLKDSNGTSIITLVNRTVSKIDIRITYKGATAAIEKHGIDYTIPANSVSIHQKDADCIKELFVRFTSHNETSAWQKVLLNTKNLCGPQKIGLTYDKSFKAHAI